jgi:prepilin-type N-terminal cleavage/methylation domain-containing protein
MNYSFRSSRRRRGFTLIELLVVIAIIGILSAVVLAALNTARDKGNDAATKSNLDNARPQATLYYDDNNDSYTGVCDTLPTAASGIPSANAMLVGAATSSGSTLSINRDLATAGDWNLVTCHEDGTDWAAEAPLKASAAGSPDMWCVDNSSRSKEEFSNLGASATACN